MIISFHSRTAQDIFDGAASAQARKISPVLWHRVQRKMDMLNAALALNDLRMPPGNKLEALKGDLKGEFSIRVNDQYRLIFGFKDGNVYNVDIRDYH